MFTRGKRLAALVALLVLTTAAGGWLPAAVASVAARWPAAADRLTPLTEQAAGTPVWPSVVAAVLGAVVALPQVGWGPLRRLLTLFHEAGHVVVGLALGGRPDALVVNGDGSGHASFRWRPAGRLVSRLRVAAVAVAGDVAGPLFVLASVHTYVTLGPLPVWTLLAAMGLLTLLLSRSLLAFGLAAAVLTLAGAALHPVSAPWSAGVLVWLLTAVAVTATVDLGLKLTGTLADGSDQRVVGRALLLPSRVVMGVQAFGGWAAAGAAVLTFSRYLAAAG